MIHCPTCPVCHNLARTAHPGELRRWACGTFETGETHSSDHERTLTLSAECVKHAELWQEYKKRQERIKVLEILLAYHNGTITQEKARKLLGRPTADLHSMKYDIIGKFEDDATSY
jgi:hypothetical protein